MIMMSPRRTLPGLFSLRDRIPITPFTTISRLVVVAVDTELLFGTTTTTIARSQQQQQQQNHHNNNYKRKYTTTTSSSSSLSSSLVYRWSSQQQQQQQQNQNHHHQKQPQQTQYSSSSSTSSSASENNSTTISTPATRVDTVVIGAGVIGLAIARALLMSSSSQLQQSQNREVLLVDRTGYIGYETSSRNSEVIHHGGIYYPYHYQKTKLCFVGRKLLHHYCTVLHNHIPYHNCGKLIIAPTGPTIEKKDQTTTTTTIHPKLQQLYDNVQKNIRCHYKDHWNHKLLKKEYFSNNNECGYDPMDQVYLLNSNEIYSMESSSSIVAEGGGLYSPCTSVFDTHSYYKQLLYDIQLYESSCTVLLQSPVTDARIQYWNNNKNNNEIDSLPPPQQHRRPTIELYVDGMWLQCTNVINCAGLGANHIASMIHGTSTTGSTSSNTTTTSTITKNNTTTTTPSSTTTVSNNNHPKWIPPNVYYAKGTYFKLQGNGITTSSSSSNSSNGNKEDHHQQQGKPTFQHLIYPLPQKQNSGLGIHATLKFPHHHYDTTTTSNNVPHIKFGPDVEWLYENNHHHHHHHNENDTVVLNQTTDTDTTTTTTTTSNTMRPLMNQQLDEQMMKQIYQPNDERKEIFYQAIKSYWPLIQRDMLVPDYVGIRPKLYHPQQQQQQQQQENISTTNDQQNQHKDKDPKMVQQQPYHPNPVDDFCICDSTIHGIPGLIHLFGIESPGLTSSLAIAEYVVEIVERDRYK